jgi:hypothetical protein
MWYESVGVTNILLVLVVAVNIAILLEIWRVERNKNNKSS